MVWVFPGWAEVLARAFRFISALISEDFPTLDFPANANSGRVFSGSLLVTPQTLMITVQINEYAEKGAYGIACAFATILIIITYAAVVLMNVFIKQFGTSAKINAQSEGE